MNNKIRLKIRDLVRRGGNRPGNQLKIASPKVDATNASQKLETNMADRARADQELVDMNKALSGGAVVVPQMQQAGSSGNDSIKQQIGSALQGNADGQFDTAVMSPDAAAKTKSSIGGRRRRRKSRRKSKKKRKSRRKRKSRKKSRRKSKRRRRKSKKRRR